MSSDLDKELEDEIKMLEEENILDDELSEELKTLEDEEEPCTSTYLETVKIITKILSDDKFNKMFDGDLKELIDIKDNLSAENI